MNAHTLPRPSRSPPPTRLVHFSPALSPTLRPLPTVWDRERSKIVRNNFILKNIAKVSPSRAYQPKNTRQLSQSAESLSHSNHSANSKPTNPPDSHSASQPQKCAKNSLSVNKHYSQIDKIIEKKTDNIDKPSSFYRFNSFVFLNSLREYPYESSLNRAMNSKAENGAVVDSFVKLKTAEFESLTNGQDHQQHSPNSRRPLANQSAAHSPTTASSQPQAEVHENGNNVAKETLYKKRLNPASSSNGHSFRRSFPQNANHRSSRPKNSSSSSPQGHQSSYYNHHGNRLQASKSTPKLHIAHEHEEDDNEDGNKSEADADEEQHLWADENDFEPYFHRSLDKISSIANWEKQIRYELEIEKELQRRELDRQKEKLQSDQRKLEEWDKQLRIELDARERKTRLSEDEYKSRMDDFEQRTKDLARKEQMINEIVADRIKTEMKFEIEKLRKKFNELELEKSNLAKKEERVKGVEARLHEQVKIVKEKIDGKRLSDIELAKYKKELEILKKENEVLKGTINKMEDYQVNKFENRALKSELQILKDSLDSKNQELERERDRWEKEQRATDQKILSLRAEVRQAEQELVILKQKSQGDLEEMTSKFEATSGQFKRLQLFVRELQSKVNTTTPSHYHQKSMPSSSYSKMSPNGHFYSNAHRRHNSLSSSGSHLYGGRQPTRSTSGLQGVNGRTISGAGAKGIHQRSISMDDHDMMSVRRKAMTGNGSSTSRQLSRGCSLCEDDDIEDHQHPEFSQSNEYLHHHSDDHFYNHSNGGIDDIFEEEPIHRNDVYNEDIGEEEEEDERRIKHEGDQEGDEEEIFENKNIPQEHSSQNLQTDEMVDIIMGKIYEKISNSPGNSPTKNPSKKSDFLKNDNLLISKLLHSMAIEHVENNAEHINHFSPPAHRESHPPPASDINHHQRQPYADHHQESVFQLEHQHRQHSTFPYSAHNGGSLPYHSPPKPQVDLEIDPTAVPETVQQHGTSLYDELLPFTSSGQMPNIILSPGSIQKNDNNNNNLHVQQKTPPKTSAEPTQNGIRTLSGTEENAGSSQIVLTSPGNGSALTGSGKVQMLKEVTSGSNNKTSDESSKSESFEVDW